MQGHFELRSSVETIQFFSLKSLVFVMHFLNTFLHGNETFPKDSSQNEIFPLLVVFHLPYSKYKGVKICFYSCRYQNQKFLLVSHSCRLCNTRVALVSLAQHSRCQCCIRVTFVSLVSDTCAASQTRSMFLHYYRVHHSAATC